jgi:hypothetical protein
VIDAAVLDAMAGPDVYVVPLFADGTVAGPAARTSLRREGTKLVNAEVFDLENWNADGEVAGFTVWRGRDLTRFYASGELDPRTVGAGDIIRIQPGNIEIELI